uniref:Uncharacterized protein n=1 Tax=Setaria digitata TaxID=48799 RepID=A0A915PG10_9BILA
MFNYQTSIGSLTFEQMNELLTAITTEKTSGAPPAVTSDLRCFFDAVELTDFAPIVTFAQTNEQWGAFSDVLVIVK